MTETSLEPWQQENSIGCWRLALAEMRKKLLIDGKYTIPPQNEEEAQLAKRVSDGPP
jgi:hypothetical protein